MKVYTTDSFVTLSVRVTPRSTRSEIAAVDDGLWKVRLAAPPVDGAANTELVKLLARCFGVNKSNVEITSGLASRNKIIRIHGIDNAGLQEFAERFFS